MAWKYETPRNPYVKHGVVFASHWLSETQKWSTSASQPAFLKSSVISFFCSSIRCSGGRASFATNSGNPSEPYSSMPSYRSFKRTGSFSPSFRCASTTQSHDKAGPLSSDAPRPHNRPSGCSVSSNGSVSQPSAFLAGCTSRWP